MTRCLKFIPFILLAVALVAPSISFAASYHHVHLTATDIPAAAKWYADVMGGVIPESAVRKDRVEFGDILMVFFKRKAGFPGSEGSGIDRIGFFEPDVDAKLEELETAGAKILRPGMNIGKVRIAFIEDPWGTKIELIQAGDRSGLASVHLMSPDPKETLAWYQSAFGGETADFLDMPILPSLRYGDFSLVFHRTTKEIAPTKGRSFDHLGFGVSDLDATAERLKAQGVHFSMNPVPFGKLRVSFVDGPHGVRIEVVQPAAK